MKKAKVWIEKHEGLILIILLVVILRIPSLYEPYWYGDEGIYLVLGQAVRKGLVLYRDIHDNKPPMLYWLAAVANNVYYFRLMLMIWFGVGVGVFYKFMKVLFPNNKKAWYVSTLAMIGLTTVTEGNIANAEIFIVLPVTLAMYWAYVKKESAKWWEWIGIGLLFCTGFMLKVPAGFDFAALVVWFLIFSGKDGWAFSKKSLAVIIKNIIDKRLWLLIIGFLLPIGLSLIYYAKAGGFEPYLRSALMQNIGYLSSWETGEHSNSGFSSQSGLLNRAGLLALSLAGFYWVAKRFKISKGASLIVVWFLMGLFGALLSERPYPHYLIQPAVPLAILISYFLFGRRKVLKLVILFFSLGAGWFYYQIRFWNYPIIPYYQNYIDYSLRRKSLEEYRNYFDPRVNQTYELAEYVKKRTKSDERIFIWGDEPFVYALADRLPTGRYTVAYHVVDFNGYKETMEAFDKFQPRVVVVMEYEKRPFPKLMTRLMIDYTKVDKIGHGVIYRRINGMK